MKVESYFFKPQLDFVLDESPVSAFIGGVGAGKTLTGVRWIIKEALENPGKHYYLCANTYPQIKDILVPKLFKVLNDWGLKENIHFTYNKQDKDLFLTNGSVLMLRSLQKFNYLRGAEVSGALIDEARDVEEEAVKVIIGRLRESDRALLKLTTTPNGYNWLYEWIQSGRVSVYKMTTFDNTFLSNEYIDLLTNQYSGDFLRQELYAEFVNFGGKLVYKEFDRRRHIIPRQDIQSDTVYIGMDFNIDPFCAVVAVKDDDKIVVIDEIVLRGLSVDDMVAEIKKRFPDKRYLVFPDSSGKNRELSKAESLISQLIKGFDCRECVKFFSKNPRIVDRIQVLNNWLKKDKIKIYETLDFLIRDLERVKFVESGAFELDKSNKELTHISDALGYMIYYLHKTQNQMWINM